MSSRKRWQPSILLTPLALSLLTAVLGAMLLILPLGQSVEEAVGLDRLFQQRGARAAPAETVVIPIEKRAADTLGLPNQPERWPRALHARLVDRLHEAGAAVIVFDIHFKEPRADDDAFATALRRTGNVVLFAYLDRDSIEPLAEIERLVPPTPALADAAAAIAPFALPKLPVRVSRFWSVQESAGGVASLPLAALEQYALPEVPTLATVINMRDVAAARRLQQAARLTRPAALAELRAFLQATPLEAWAKIEHALPRETVTRLTALYNTYHGDPHPYLNFYGPPRSVVTTLSYSDALETDPAVLAAQVRGKVVFIGFAEQRQPQQRDSFYTVYTQPDGLDLSGVEIAATAFANLLHRDALQSPTTLPALLLVIFYGFLIALLCRRLPALTAVACGLALAGVYYFAAAQLFNAQHLWLPLVIPLLVQTPIALFLGVFGHYWQSRHEGRRLRRTFGHYVPDHVIERALTHQDGVHAPGEARYGICLATDAARYTQLAETMTSTELSALMNEYYETLFAPVRARQGIISDVVGDAMLAIWTGPHTQGLLRAQAVDAALALHAAADEFSRRQGHPTLVTRIGLHCGELVMGNVGALDHFEYRAVGDIVNTANRIQSLNKHLGTQLLASDSVLEDIDGIVARPLGRYRLAGKQQCVAIHEVLGRESEVDATRRIYLAHFAAALHLFTDGNWRGAQAAFSTLQREAPEDGPTRFFLGRCRRYLAQPPADWQGVLVLTEK